MAQQHRAQEEAPPAQEEAPPVHVEEEEVEEDESSLGSRAAMERVMADIPKKFHTNFTRLGRYLQANPDLIRITQAGRPIVAGQELGRAHISDIMRSLYTWPKSQPLPSGVKEVIEALHSAGTPSYLLSNTAVRTMYQRLQEPGERPHAETQTEREEYEEEVMGKPETTPFQTPQHSLMRPQPAMLKAEQHAPTRPMKDETKRASRIPAMPTKPVSSKASTGQQGKGYKFNGGRVCGDVHQASSKSSASQVGNGYKTKTGKQPIRVLRVPRIPAKHVSSNASVGWTEQGYKANTEDVRMPGKPIRWYYLY